jgi:hypothetical protein
VDLCATSRLCDIAARPEGLGQQSLLLILAPATPPLWPRDQR